MNGKLITTIMWSLVALALLSLGAYIENDFVMFLENLGDRDSFVPIAIFFSSVNISIIVLFVLVFLVFRSGVKLVVDRRKTAFGSRLRTKLVTSFLFFSLLPTVVLLYLSTKFVNANFERFLPASLVNVTSVSLRSEGFYRKRLAEIMGEKAQFFVRNDFRGLDFVYNPDKKDLTILTGPLETKQTSEVQAYLADISASVRPKPEWFESSSNLNLLLMKDTQTQRIFGILGPESVHKSWQFVSHDVEGVQPGIELIKVSYYVMLGVVTLLVVFSATWLGFTVAREFTIPIQVLAEASASVARGNYDVRIDDIVSDDELGSLARSFRAMVGDLKLAHENERMAAQMLMQKADELYEKSLYNDVLLRDINAAVLTLDEKGVIETWNQEAVWLFEVQESEALGRMVQQVLPANFVFPFLADISDRVTHAPEARAQGEFVGKMIGNDVHLQVAVSLVKSPKGGENRVVFVNDFTELAKAQRVAAWRDVARKIAHEIKNPLTPIKLGAQRLERKFSARFKDNESEGRAFQDCIDVIVHSTDSIKALVNEFLQFSRMPTAKLHPGNLLSAVKIAVASFQESSEAVLVSLRAESDEASFEAVLFDRDQIIRLCTNLISNALAASAGLGESHVDVVVRANKEMGFAQIEIRDQGVGVPESLKEKIFEPYFSTKRTGMGLGLVIVQQIVSEHGGRLSIESNKPQGTVVLFEFPLDGMVTA